MKAETLTTDPAAAGLKPAHTPGPWTYNDLCTVVQGNPEDWDATCIASLRHRDFGNNNVADNKELQANARLIAAAPELLAACKAWELARIDGGISHADFYEAAWKKTRAAIAKAEGNAPAAGSEE